MEVRMSIRPGGNPSCTTRSGNERSLTARVTEPNPNARSACSTRSAFASDAFTSTSMSPV
jgi:hypothetical protein